MTTGVWDGEPGRLTLATLECGYQIAARDARIRRRILLEDRDPASPGAIAIARERARAADERAWALRDEWLRRVSGSFAIGWVISSAITAQYEALRALARVARAVEALGHPRTEVDRAWRKLRDEVVRVVRRRASKDTLAWLLPEGSRPALGGAS